MPRSRRECHYGAQKEEVLAGGARPPAYAHKGRTTVSELAMQRAHPKLGSSGKPGFTDFPEPETGDYGTSSYTVPYPEAPSNSVVP
jgi:hypothetical protein